MYWKAIARVTQTAVLIVCFSIEAAWAGPSALMTKKPTKWQAVTLQFAGPKASQMDTDPNPFLDHRLNVTFTAPSGRAYVVPGYFDGDGRGGPSGNVWAARFTPDEAGQWSFAASLRRGKNVAVELNPSVGEAVALPEAAGSFTVAERDRTAPGFARYGRLEYAGGHYLKFREGPYWIKGGTDSPEDLLAYAGFDNTRSGSQFGVKDYAAHVRDWKPGDPDWGDGRGKAIIGAMNYLASRNVNLIYFLPMNIGGDGKNVWPFAGSINPDGDAANDNVHYDLAKLRQWEILFQHAQNLGIVLHFVLNEAEKPNKMELGGRELTTERKLFYRELVARFGHHNAIIWNLCEEYNLQLDLLPENIKKFARYLQNLDAYDHPITVHHAGEPVKALAPFLGDPLFSITSIQIGRGDIEPVVEKFRKLTREAGRPLPVAVDEFTVTASGPAAIPTDDRVALRKEKFWPAYLSGGQIEVILPGLLQTQDFRKFESLWDYLWYARKFLEENVPFWEMEPADDLLAGGAIYKGVTASVKPQVFSKAGECYAIYLPQASQTGTLDLSKASGRFEQRWYNPRTGQFEGSPQSVSGGQPIQLGPPPSDPAEDWAVLITKVGKGK